VCLRSWSHKEPNQGRERLVRTFRQQCPHLLVGLLVERILCGLARPRTPASAFWARRQATRRSSAGARMGSEEIGLTLEQPVCSRMESDDGCPGAEAQLTGGR
jgi:hypothetical protein